MHAQLIKDREFPHQLGLEWGPVLQTDIGRTQLNLNLFLERVINPEAPKPMQLKYQWQVKHRYRPLFEFGLQGFGEVGEWDQWAPRSRQSHRLGPMIAGTWTLGGKQAIKYQLAWLKGGIYSVNGYMLSSRIQYLFD